MIRIITKPSNNAPRLHISCRLDSLLSASSRLSILFGSGFSGSSDITAPLVILEGIVRDSI